MLLIINQPTHWLLISPLKTVKLEDLGRKYNKDYISLQKVWRSMQREYIISCLSTMGAWGSLSVNGYSSMRALPVDMSLPPLTVLIAGNEASCTS